MMTITLHLSVEKLDECVPLPQRGETLNGGAGIVVTRGDPANTTTLFTKQQHVAAITSSYDEENVASGDRVAYSIVQSHGLMH